MPPTDQAPEDVTAFLAAALHLIGTAMGAASAARLLDLLGGGHRMAVRRLWRNELIRQLDRECRSSALSIRHRAFLVGRELVTAASVASAADIAGDRKRQLARQILALGRKVPRGDMLRLILAGSDTDLGELPPLAIHHLPAAPSRNEQDFSQRRRPARGASRGSAYRP